MNTLREKIKGESFDYIILMDCLKEYSSPRSKVTRLLKSGDIIRVKKGLYIFSQKQRLSLLSLEVLANQIYGPSYVSLEYALSYFGLIPEFVAEVTNVTTKRHKKYETPIGRFSYTPIPVSLFSIGFTLYKMNEYESALIALPEKALADLFFTKKFKINSNADLEALLFEDLRLDPAGIKKFRIGILLDILTAGGHPTVSLLIDWLRSRK